MQKIQKFKGYTLVELMLVLSIGAFGVGVLSVIVILVGIAIKYLGS